MGFAYRAIIDGKEGICSRAGSRLTISEVYIPSVLSQFINTLSASVPVDHLRRTVIWRGKNLEILQVEVFGGTADPPFFF